MTPHNITHRSPSNIALVKYWGKYGVQLPRNPSISFTLTNAYSETSMQLVSRNAANGSIELDFTFEGEKNEAFRSKQVKFLESIVEHFPFLHEYGLQVSSSNSFPHSAGIASSASAMSALALCLCDAERQLTGNLQNEADFLRKASIISRLGSGSACRSVYPQLAAWGQTKHIEGSSNEYAVPYGHEVDTVFHSFHDDILIVSSAEKSVSSRAGHALMEGNPFAAPRYQQADDNLGELLAAMKTGDLEKFGVIVENEALTLHALMMCSYPSFVLLQPNSLAIIERIKQFRDSEKLPFYFTIDAGPNIHFLYPDSVAEQAKSFIDNELRPLCENGKVVIDKVQG